MTGIIPTEIGNLNNLQEFEIVDGNAVFIDYYDDDDNSNTYDDDNNKPHLVSLALLPISLE